MTEASTPLMRQYQSIKRQVPDALLLFRLGDFYELFYEDAVVAARELQITLTSRSKEKDIPMCGVPYHSASTYISRLIQRGHRVAICEQVEDPKTTKTLVRREVMRVVSPGTAIDGPLLQPHENTYLAAVSRYASQAGLAWADLSTGEFRATELDASELDAQLESLRPKEILVSGPTPAPLLTGVLQTNLEPWTFGDEYAHRILLEQFRLHSLDGVGLRDRPLATGAAGALVHYLRDTQKSALEHLERPSYVERGQSMLLDAVTVRNLELVDPLFAGEQRETTLFHALDLTRTGMGARLLRKRLLAPTLDLAEIEARLDALAQLHARPIVRGQLRELLGGVLDLERLLARVTLGSVNPRELLSLARSLTRLPQIKPLFDGHDWSERWSALLAELDVETALGELLCTALADEPPINLADGGVIRSGYHPPLDELRALSHNSREYVARLEQRERTRTGIHSLKVRFNNVFGYYIEISKANLALAPADYERKQTVANAERFTTPELKQLEVKILDAEERSQELERELFASLRQSTAARAEGIRRVAAAVAQCDVYAALAEVAAEYRYTRPTFSGGPVFRIEAGRHPVVERLAERDAVHFIPNDLYLDRAGKFIAVITGPNMGGKSTYLRQAALIAILAQSGSFVPAAKAVLPLFDRVFTRIGAADNLARGRSTFMVEMTETAVILNGATARSLVILDEIGRGTSTYDGLALAWSVVEHLHGRTGACTLFATHYHELTQLADALPGVANLHVTVKESGDQILFLRRVEPGAADRSYGIEVARLAGLPPSVIERAQQVLRQHEATEERVTNTLAPSPAGPMQIQLFEPVNHGIADRIRQLNLDQLRPIEALSLLAELQQELSR